MRYIRRTEAGCGIGLGDDQFYVAHGETLEFDESLPADMKIANDLASWTHGWVEVDADGNPFAYVAPPEKDAPTPPAGPPPSPWPPPLEP